MRSSGVMPPSPVVVRRADLGGGPAQGLLGRGRQRAEAHAGDGDRDLELERLGAVAGAEHGARSRSARGSPRAGSATTDAVRKTRSSKVGQLAAGAEAADRVVAGLGHLVDAGDDVGREGVRCPAGARRRPVRSGPSVGAVVVGREVVELAGRDHLGHPARDRCGRTRCPRPAASRRARRRRSSPRRRRRRRARRWCPARRSPPRRASRRGACPASPPMRMVPAWAMKPGHGAGVAGDGQGGALERDPGPQ